MAMESPDSSTDSRHQGMHLIQFLAICSHLQQAER
jgi:hypothetical protein